MADIVYIGAGDLAEVMAGYLDHHGDDRLVGFAVDPQYRTAESFCGRPVVDWDRLEERFPPSQVKLLGPFSYFRLNKFREERYWQGVARGYAFASFIHPTAQIYTDKIGDNVLVLDFVSISASAELGTGAVIWIQSHVGHHCKVGDFTFVGAQSGLSGRCTVGKRCFFGGKVGLWPKVTIGDDTIIMPGAAVKNDVPAGAVVEGRSAAVSKVPSSRLAGRLR